MGEPRVVHCKREKCDVYVGRPSKWGNKWSDRPGTMAEFVCASREEAIQKYHEWIMHQPDLISAARRELKGKVLGCWCAPNPCHGDILLKIANS